MSEYDIVTNTKGRRILVVNELVNLRKEESLQFGDFDAIFINLTHLSFEENRLLVRWTSPIREAKCFLKPRFASTALESYIQMVESLIDGFCTSPLDSAFTDFIETVYENLDTMHFVREMVPHNYSTAHYTINFIKFDLSRGRRTFTNTTVKGMAEGYNKLFTTWYSGQETLQSEERHQFGQRIEELGYVVKEQFVDRIHLCPSCGHSHLLFRETCPKCGSSNITQQSMIHHFRCANVSPESSYQYDGRLRCPKCKQFLHHIGVDYDRPAAIYTCNQCDNHFINSVMKVRCGNCGKDHTPEELRAHDVWTYRYTEKGIRAFATNEALFEIENQSIFSGYSKVPEMETAIRDFPTLPIYHDHVIVLQRYYLNNYNSENSPRFFELIRTIIMRITTIRIAHDGNDLYVMLLIHESQAFENARTVTSIMKQLFKEYASMGKSFGAVLYKQYSMHYTENPENLIRAMKEPIAIDERMLSKAI